MQEASFDEVAAPGSVSTWNVELPFGEGVHEACLTTQAKQTMIVSSR